MSNTKLVIGMDIGGTHIRIGAGKGNGKLIEFTKVPRTDILNGVNSVENLAVFIEDYMHEKLNGAKVTAITIGLPSTVSKDRRTILQTPNIENMDNVPLADILEKKLGIQVFLEKDTNLLFFEDMDAKNLSKEGIGIGVYIGTGIGNAIFINGNPLSGKDGVAGEIGHIPVLNKIDVCGCGNEGCVECYASGKHLFQIKEHSFPQTIIDDLFTEHGESRELKDFVNDIACVVATEINILNPEYVILGGGVIGMKYFPKDYLELCIHKHVRKPFPDQNLCIYYSASTAEDGVKGAILYGLNRINQINT